mmetsp:Transcript_60678/g.130288  ORF Transcript_60678/g.130288 Transcript_60678/m.130288 type:complete len:297 (+) Transcript_60678:575-1465(+)
MILQDFVNQVERDETVPVDVGLVEGAPELIELAVLDLVWHQEHPDHVAEQLVLKLLHGLAACNPLIRIQGHHSLQPGVLQSTSRGGALVCWLEKPLDEVPAERTAVGPSIGVPPVGEEARAKEGFVVDGRMPRKECMRNCADAPQVCRSRNMAPKSREDLRCCVMAWGRRVVLDERLLGIQGHHEAHISDLDRGIGHLRGEQEAARAQVAVLDSLGMAVSYRDESCPDVLGHSPLLEPVTFLLHAHHPLADIASLALVEDDIQATRVLEHVDNVADVLVTQLLQTLELDKGVAGIL